MVRRPATALTACAIAALGGCSNTTEPAGQPPAAAKADRCKRAPRAAVRVLDDSLTVRGRLKRARMVKSHDAGQVTLPGFQRGGLYLVSAQLDDGSDNPIVLTWAVSGELVKTGGGLAYPAEAGARKFSQLGADVDARRLGIDMGLDGYGESRDCAGA